MKRRYNGSITHRRFEPDLDIDSFELLYLQSNNKAFFVIINSIFSSII